MRPLELRIRNFRSYFGEEAVFDFRDRRLVGVVGPIGSGKSSILDAIAFALYGRTPRIARSTRSLIHQRADHAAVALRFSVDGDVWEVQRVIRRKGQSQHALYRFDVDAPVAQPVDKIVQEAEVLARIEQILGLDFDAFGRSVMLAQGQFAEFLTARPAERDKVLKGVFGYDRIDTMRERARERARDAALDADKAALEVEQLTELRSQVTEERDRVERLERRKAQLEEAAGEFSAVTDQRREAAAELADAKSRSGAMATLAERLPDRASVAELADALATLDAEGAAAAADLEAAVAAVAEAEATLERFPSDERDQLEEAARLVATREAAVRRAADLEDRLRASEADLEAAVAAVAEGRADLERIEASLRAATERKQAATAALLQRRERLHQARHADMALSLRRELAPGRPCPVCEQEVPEVPAIPPSPDVEDAAAAVAAGEIEAEAAVNDHAAAAASLEAARVRLEAAMARVGEHEAQIEELRGDLRAAGDELTEIDRQLAAILGEGDTGQLLRRRRKALADAEAAVADARRNATEARARHDQIMASGGELRRDLDELLLRVAELGATVGLSAPARDADPEKAVVALHEATAAETQRAVARVEAATVALEEADARLAQLRERLEIEGSVAEALAGVGAEVAAANRHIERARARLGALPRAIAARDEALAATQRYERLAADLTDARFVRFLLDEERYRLAALGSDHLERLSNGRYRFTDDGTFAIVDLAAADAIRKADSLSGGETFLASLALALGLAEIVARTGGRMDAFFLDEGFGTLDPEHLDLAMEGIEALVAAAEGRLVVIVSHVPEMRERIEDLVELDRDPVTGDTIVVRA